MGLKPITVHLNDRNIRTRDGGRFGIAAVHQILTRTTYFGGHKFNYRDYRTKGAKPEAGHAIMAVHRSRVPGRPGLAEVAQSAVDGAVLGKRTNSAHRYLFLRPLRRVVGDDPDRPARAGHHSAAYR